MTTKTKDALLRLLGNVRAGRAVYPEDVDRVVNEEGLDADEVLRLAVNPTPVFEWEDVNAAQGHVPTQIPKHLVSGEEAAAKATEKSQVIESGPLATGSNDPAVNPLATGQKPFENAGGVGSSGQVANPEEYQDDKKKK